MPHRLPQALPQQRIDVPTLAWLALLALAVVIYAFGLGGQYNPSNGDELVYTHIARLTAASGQWLPLVSDLDQMRNTKPPLRFWQALLAGDWGQHWSLAFFSTFRYGRTFLTSAPETFWLNLPLFWLLWLRLRAPAAQVNGLG